ncbi:MAG: hypothetical protein LBC26_06560 [Oscillospiraceae bacterium]|nr:hypothetical protein [Oscillospiraceae bacterium]
MRNVKKNGKGVRLLPVCALVFTLLTPAARAAPSAEVALSIADAVYESGESGDIIVTVDIAVGAPTEPYASLDFNLVSSDYEHLRILDLDDDEKVTALDIMFTPDYGQAYHRGRVDEETGGYRYLMGIYAQTGGNLIAGATDVCTVRLRYRGEETQTLQLRDVKLIYIDDTGGVGDAPVDSSFALLTIDRHVMTAVDGQDVPLGSMPAWDEPVTVPATGDVPALWIVLSALAGAAAVLAAVIIMRWVHAKKRSREREQAG